MPSSRPEVQEVQNPSKRKRREDEEITVVVRSRKLDGDSGSTTSMDGVSSREPPRKRVRYAGFEKREKEESEQRVQDLEGGTSEQPQSHISSPMKRKRDDQELDGEVGGLRQAGTVKDGKGNDGQRTSESPKKKARRDIGEVPIWAQSVRDEKS